MTTFADEEWLTEEDWLVLVGVVACLEAGPTTEVCDATWLGAGKLDEWTVACTVSLSSLSALLTKIDLRVCVTILCLLRRYDVDRSMLSLLIRLKMVGIRIN